MNSQAQLTDHAIILSEADNVATALRDVPAGTYAFADGTLTLPADVASGFKIAVAPIAAGQPVYKYGHVIGIATIDIAPGENVHVHNIRSSVQ